MSGVETTTSITCSHYHNVSELRVDLELLFWCVSVSNGHCSITWKGRDYRFIVTCKMPYSIYFQEQMPDFGTWTGVELITRFVLGWSTDFSTSRTVTTLSVHMYGKVFTCKNPYMVDSLILCEPNYSFTSSIRRVELYRANPARNPASALLSTTCVACRKTQLPGIKYSFKYKITSSDVCPRPRPSFTCPEAP